MGVEGLPPHGHHISLLVQTYILHIDNHLLVCCKHTHVIVECEIFGEVTLQGRQVNQLALQHIRSKLCQGLTCGNHLKSLRKITLAFALPTHVKFVDAGLVKVS